jgi:hypothetical protein
LIFLALQPIQSTFASAVDSEMKVSPASPLKTLAVCVLPVPGGPTKSKPLGTVTPCWA